MFTEGPLKNFTHPIVMFNIHEPDYVKEFPRAKRGTFDRTTGKKMAKNTTAVPAALAAAAANATTTEEGDDELEDTVAQQVIEVDFVDADSMDKIVVKNLKPGMLKLCMI